VIVNALAVIGALCLFSSVTWFIFFWRTGASGEHDPAEPTPLPASEVVARHTGNVRVLPPETVTRGGETFIRYDVVERDEDNPPPRVTSWVIDGYPYWSETQVTASRERPDRPAS
jgi:hypothetical protein